MRPILFRLDFGDWTLNLPAYGTAMCLAIITVIGVGWITAHRQGLPAWRSFVCVAGVALAFPIGSRLAYALVHLDQLANSSEVLFELRFRGFLLPGGLVLAAATLLTLGPALRLSPWQVVDAMAPALGLGSACMRLGCFLNGCCFGRETTLPCGVVFPVGSPAHLSQAQACPGILFTVPRPVHPTQLYQLAAGLVAAAVAWYLLRRRAPAGTAALAALLWYLAFRWANRAFRVNVAEIADSTSHLLYLGSIVLTAGWLWTRARGRHAVESV